MSKFKVEDRVTVYGWIKMPDRQVPTYLRGSKGTIVDAYLVDEIKVFFDDGLAVQVHPKQCRFLKKKERRRV